MWFQLKPPYYPIEEEPNVANRMELGQLRATNPMLESDYKPALIRIVLNETFVFSINVLTMADFKDRYRRQRKANPPLNSLLVVKIIRLRHADFVRYILRRNTP